MIFCNVVAHWGEIWHCIEEFLQRGFEGFQAGTHCAFGRYYVPKSWANDNDRIFKSQKFGSAYSDGGKNCSNTQLIVVTPLNIDKRII